MTWDQSSVEPPSLNPRLWENQRSKNKCVCYRMATTKALFIDRINWMLRCIFSFTILSLLWTYKHHLSYVLVSRVHWDRNACMSTKRICMCKKRNHLFIQNWSTSFSSLKCHHLRHRHSVVCEKYDSWSLDRFFFSVPAHATCFHWSAPRLDCRGLTWNRHHRKRMDVLLRLFTWMHPCMGK